MAQPRLPWNEDNDSATKSLMKSFAKSMAFKKIFQVLELMEKRQMARLCTFERGTK